VAAGKAYIPAHFYLYYLVCTYLLVLVLLLPAAPAAANRFVRYGY